MDLTKVQSSIISRALICLQNQILEDCQSLHNAKDILGKERFERWEKQCEEELAEIKKLQKIIEKF